MPALYGFLVSQGGEGLSDLERDLLDQRVRELEQKLNRLRSGRRILLLLLETSAQEQARLRRMVSEEQQLRRRYATEVRRHRQLLGGK